MEEENIANTYNEKGNDYYKKKEYRTALEWYTKAIDADSTNAIY